MNICLYGAASERVDEIYCSETERLGRSLARRGHGLVFGGGANGMMGAAARGVKAENGTIIGVVPSFFNVDGVLFEGAQERIYTDTMRDRKALMEARSDAFVMTPGGLGTLDEFFEMITLRQLNRHQKPVAVYNIAGYYDPLLAFLEKAAADRFIHEPLSQLFGVFDDPEALLDYLERVAGQKKR